MTTTRVTYSNLVSGPWQIVFDLIDNRANIADPVSAVNRKFVYNRLPDTKSVDFKGYPFIVVNESKMVHADGRKRTLDGKSQLIDFQVEVEVYSSDVAYGALKGQGSEHNHNISDAIVELFHDHDTRVTLRGLGLLFSIPEVEEATTLPINEQLVWQRSIKLNFRTKMQVTA